MRKDIIPWSEETQLIELISDFKENKFNGQNPLYILYDKETYSYYTSENPFTKEDIE